MTTIRKVQITAFGDESKLAIVTADLPEPGRHQVQLAVDLSVVSGSDVNMRRGVYPLQKKPPLTPGYSVIGRVVEIGPGAFAFRLGDLVACLTKYEGQAERINLPEKYLVPVPPAVDPEQAVALILDWLTAFQMLHRAAKVKAGQRVFIHGLSGGVGSALMRLARLAGAEVFGTASVPKHDELRRQGAAPFDYRSTDWVAAMQALGGVHAVFDPLGFESFDRSYAVLARGGILVAYGLNLPNMTGARRRAALPVILKLFARNLALWTGKRTTFYGLTRTSKHYKPDLTQLFHLLETGQITVPIKAVFPLDQIYQAHREYAGSDRSGSIILRIPC